MFSLAGRIALVTGGSRGIGRATAELLARAGARVVVNDVPTQAAATQAAEVVEAVERAGGVAEAKQFDVADPQAVDQALEELHGRLGRVDILVNNAGIARDQLLLRIKVEELAETWAVNLNGAIYCAKAAIRIMMRQRFGRVIQVSSVVAEAGNPGQVAYGASKAALIGLTKTLAREYASRGITVNAVAPGFIDTNMTKNLTDAQRAALVEQTPVGRVGRPDEVAAAILYLASDEAAYVTGQVLRINGGLYM